MTRTVTVAFVLCLCASTANAETSGWVLMRPPLGIEYLETDAPISEWHQVAAFDTAKECMQEKLTLEGLFSDMAEDTESAAWTIALEVVEASRCVPAEYVYGGRGARQGSSGGGAAQPDTSGEIAVLAGTGDFTGGNPDLLPEIYAFDQAEPALLFVVSKTRVEWQAESGSIRYDVVRGDLSLVVDGGATEVDLGPVTCLADDTPRNYAFDGVDPDPGQGFYYLFRGSQGLNAGPGSYGTSTDGRERLPSSGDCAGS